MNKSEIGKAENRNQAYVKFLISTFPIINKSKTETGKSEIKGKVENRNLEI
jgi:hypothetical protein